MFFPGSSNLTFYDIFQVSHGTTAVSPNSPETPNVSIATIQPTSNSVEPGDTTVADEDIVELEAEADNVEQKPNTTIIDEKVISWFIIYSSNSNVYYLHLRGGTVV